MLNRMMSSRSNAHHVPTRDPKGTKRLNSPCCKLLDNVIRNGWKGVRDAHVKVVLTTLRPCGAEAPLTARISERGAQDRPAGANNEFKDIKENNITPPCEGWET